jgi:hypothetical protein
MGEEDMDAFLGIIYADPDPNVPPNAMLKRITAEWSANRKLSGKGLGEINRDLLEADFWT